MLLAVFDRPSIDWHAFAPETVLLSALLLVLLLDFVFDVRAKRIIPTVAGAGLLGALLPVVTLAVDGQDRFMFGGAFAVAVETFLPVFLKGPSVYLAGPFGFPRVSFTPGLSAAARELHADQVCRSGGTAVQREREKRQRIAGRK